MILLFLILFIHFKINNLVYDFNYTSYFVYIYKKYIICLDNTYFVYMYVYFQFILLY